MLFYLFDLNNIFYVFLKIKEKIIVKYNELIGPRPTRLSANHGTELLPITITMNTFCVYNGLHQYSISLAITGSWPKVGYWKTAIPQLSS